MPPQPPVPPLLPAEALDVAITAHNICVMFNRIDEAAVGEALERLVGTEHLIRAAGVEVDGTPTYTIYTKP